MTKKRIPVVDYCKEAMELRLEKLSERDINLISFNLAKVVCGSTDDIETIMHSIDDKGEKQAIKIPSKAFLRTDRIRYELNSIGISNTKIDKYLETK